MSAPRPDNEEGRLKALHSYHVMDTQVEPAYEDLSELAAEICGCPAAYISLIDDTRQWVMTSVGLPESMAEAPRDVAICSTTICQSDVLMVPDLAKDDRFDQYPLVTEAPNLRFYCGAPLINPQGYALGSLCVVDFEPKEIGFDQREALRRLSRIVVTGLELRRVVHALDLARKELDSEKAKGDKLLLNILPVAVADELKKNDSVQPQFYESATILFTDFKGFTKLTEGLQPRQLVNTLDQFFTAFDDIMQRRRMERLKTIGDAYMCAGGLPERNKTHPVDACLAAIEMRGYAAKMNKDRLKLRMPAWEIRVGIHTGSVMAGVVGKRKFAYDIWGNTVNVASRMESAGEPGRINISEDTYERVKHLFDCESRGAIEAKNKGPLPMFFLSRIKPELSADADGSSPNERFWESVRTSA